jgi:hypothetical protein
MPAGDTSIHPFRVGFPEAELAELRRGVQATRWPAPRPDPRCRAWAKQALGRRWRVRFPGQR